VAVPRRVSQTSRDSCSTGLDYEALRIRTCETADHDLAMGLERHTDRNDLAPRLCARVNVARQVLHTTDMSALMDRLFDLWLESVDERDDPEAAFRELYADPVSINGTPTPVSLLVERARDLQRAFAGLTTEMVEQVETSERLVIAFYIRGRHVGPLLTPIGTVAPTGSTVEIRTIDVLIIADGVITALWVVSDELGMLTQLDAVQLA